VECKLITVNVRRESNPRRTFQATVGDTWMSVDSDRSTMKVIVI